MTQVLLFLFLISNFLYSKEESVPLIKQRDRLLELIAKHLPQNPIIIEAGAYDGSDTIAMSTMWPKGTIYAFEPDPVNFIKLQTKLAKAHNNKKALNVKIFQQALSNIDGYATFYQSDIPDRPGNALSGSLFKPKEHLNYSHVIFPTTTKVKTSTLDSWAEQHNIAHIDFLWFDMQGVELHVLKACPHILKTVKVIYTEVELVEAYEGQYLYKDVLQWLEKQGFTLIAKDFNEKNKKTWFGNILMVRL